MYSFFCYVVVSIALGILFLLACEVTTSQTEESCPWYASNNCCQISN